MNIQGTVEDVKSISTAYGTMYNIVVDGVSYGAGKFAPRVSPGDVVSFTAEQKGRYNNIVPKTISVVGKGAAPAPRAAPAAAAPTRGGNDFGKNQDVISKQAARNSAIAMFRELRELDALPIGKTAKAGDKLEAAVAIVDQLTEKFYNYSIGVSEVKAEAAAKAASEAEGDEPWS